MHLPNSYPIRIFARMGWKLLVIAVICTFVGLSNGFFEDCHPDVYLNIGENKTIVSPGYPKTGFSSPSSCRWRVITSREYQVKAVCSIYFYDNSAQCLTQRWLFDSRGSMDMSSADYYCGSKEVSATSIDNVLTLGYFSKQYSGHFTCTITTTCDCGRGITPRIVNGQDTSPTEFPMMAALYNPIPKTFFCGATVVASNWVMTAAHCLPIAQPNCQVAVGVHNTKSPGTYSQFLNWDYNVTYPGYNKSASDVLDIAMIRVAGYFTWSPAVSRVCLPFYYQSYDFANRRVQAIGWGTRELGGPTSAILQKVDLTVITNTECNSRLTTSKVDYTQLCTYAPGNDTCQYDSGGPILYRGSTDGRLTHVGLVSYGEGCGGKTPGVNTRTTSFVSWAESLTGPLCHLAIT